MTTVAAYAAPAAKAPLERTTIERREVGEHDVLIDIKFAGICHTDIHQVREGWGEARFPMVPGHEIAGVVSQVGPGVTKYAVGDRVGVGCMVDSCGTCDNCRAGREQHCTVGMVETYNGVDDGDGCPDRPKRLCPEQGYRTQGSLRWTWVPAQPRAAASAWSP